uniref:Uncharacterized protein n=1 Tax=Oryza punctata TaxID=4537 RepID=A0A0E0M2D8_ORYPU
MEYLIAYYYLLLETFQSFALPLQPKTKEHGHSSDTHPGNVFEEITVEGETIQSSRWPCTRSFANPVNFFRDKNSHERSDSPSLTADSAAKNNSPRTDSSPKNSASALATENNLTPGKRQLPKKP